MLGAVRNEGVDQFTPKHRPLTRVELHVHLDGSPRPETIYQLSIAKKLPLPGKGTFKELRDYLVCKKPEDLGRFLSRFDVILECTRGDLKALERIAYEFVEDSAKSGIIYSEARICPHLFIPENFAKSEEDRKKWAWDITASLIKGLVRGETDFGMKVNLIATCIGGGSDSEAWFEDTLELAADKNFHQGRICGMDICFSPETAAQVKGGWTGFDSESVDLFDRAMKHGIHRTVHAGEVGPAEEVEEALNLLHAERIGHGYRLCGDEDLYQKIKNKRVHLECCPWSSILTGSVSPFDIPHPIVKFFKDGFNVSINTDNPTITGTGLDGDYELLGDWGLCEAHFVKGNFNAARSCFLPETEKKDLIQRMGKTFGCVILN